MGSVPIEEVYSQIVEFSVEYKAKRIVLFGSRARKTNNEKSDIDIAVYGCKDFESLKDKIKDELWSLLKVDIINMDDNQLSADLVKEIERDGVVLYEKV